MTNDITRIKGSIPPVITPFKDGGVDFDTYERLIDFHVTKGSHGVLVNGTSAEPSTLTVDERNQLVDTAIRVAAGRIPVLAATGSQSLAETQALTRHAIKAGADALLIVTPYYIRPPQRGLIEYYLSVTAGSNVPWMIYHIPGRTAVQVTVDTVAQLAERSNTFVGIKHASTDLQFVSECLKAQGNDFRIFVGLEELSYPMMALGACGLMNAVGNLHPGILARLCEAVWSSDLAQARDIHERLLDLNKSVFFDTNPIPVKYMLRRLGLIPNNEHRLPMMPATPELERRLNDVLERCGLFDLEGSH